MKPVLVTGAGGLIGEAVCRLLRQSGQDVIGVGRSAPKHPHDGIRWITADLTSILSVPDVQAIVHCAAVLPQSHSDAASANANRRLDDTVLGWAETKGLDVYYASTAVIHGLGRPCPDGPADHVPPSALYLTEKARTEELGMALARRSGKKFSVLRINAPYGPRQPSNSVLLRFIIRALAGETLQFHGSGSREQDFTYCDDVAAAFVAAFAVQSGYYLIAGGQPITMRALAELVAIEADLSPERVGPSGLSDPQEGLLARFDISASSKSLGWRPIVSIEQGIRRCLNYLRGSETL